MDGVLIKYAVGSEEPIWTVEYWDTDRWKYIRLCEVDVMDIIRDKDSDSDDECDFEGKKVRFRIEDGFAHIQSFFGRSFTIRISEILSLKTKSQNH